MSYRQHGSSSKSKKKRHKRQDTRSALDFRSRSDSPKQSDDSKSLSKRIQGYEDMTPAERVRAKMKLLLDKASDESPMPFSNKLSSSVQPNQSEVLSIESDEFAPQAFHSTRQAKESLGSSVSGSHHDDVILGTSSAHQFSSSVSVTVVPSTQVTQELVTAELSDDDLTVKWIRKLTELRKRYSSVPID